MHISTDKSRSGQYLDIEDFLPEINRSAFGDALALARIRIPFELDGVGTSTGGASCLADFLRAELVVVPTTHRLYGENK